MTSYKFKECNKIFKLCRGTWGTYFVHFNFCRVVYFIGSYVHLVDYTMTIVKLLRYKVLLRSKSRRRWVNKYLYMVTQKRGKNLVVIIYIVEEGGTVKKRRQEFYLFDCLKNAVFMKTICFDWSSVQGRSSLFVFLMKRVTSKTFIACLSFLGEEQRGCLGEHHRQRW